MNVSFPYSMKNLAYNFFLFDFTNQDSFFNYQVDIQTCRCGREGESGVGWSKGEREGRRQREKEELLRTI